MLRDRLRQDWRYVGGRKGREGCLIYLIRVLCAKFHVGGVDISVTYSPHPGRCRNGIRDCGVLILKLAYSKCTVDDGVILRLVRELTRANLRGRRRGRTRSILPRPVWNSAKGHVI